MRDTQVIDALHDLLHKLRERNETLEEELKEALDDESRVIVSFAYVDPW